MCIGFTVGNISGPDSKYIIAVIYIAITGGVANSSRALIVSAPVDLTGLRARRALLTACSVISGIV